MRSLRLASVVLLLLLVAAAAVAASVSGTVTNATTGKPSHSRTVYVPKWWCCAACTTMESHYAVCASRHNTFDQRSAVARGVLKQPHDANGPDHFSEPSRHGGGKLHRYRFRTLLRKYTGI